MATAMAIPMRHVPTLMRRELGAYFLGPIAFLVLFGFQFVAWINFWELVDNLSRPQQTLSSLNDPLNYYISGSTPFWFAVLVAVPALTMRLVSEELRSGTIETLLTVPVTETEVIVAKWLAGVVMYLLLLMPFAVYLPFLYYMAHFRFDPGPLHLARRGADHDRYDVRRDRPVLQHPDAEPDHRGDLDVRGAYS